MNGPLASKSALRMLQLEAYPRVQAYLETKLNHMRLTTLL